MIDTELLSMRELAHRTNVHPDTVRKWRDHEGLRVYRLSSQRHAVIWSEFLEWLRAREIGQDQTLSAMREQ